MSQYNYLPAIDSERVIWLNQFANKLATYQTTLNISAADLLSVQHDAALFGYVVNLLNSSKQTTQNITAYKQAMKHQTGNTVMGSLPQFPVASAPPAAVSPGIFDRIGSLVQRIKHTNTCSDAIAQDLNIIATVPSVDESALQPDLKIKMEAGKPVIRFKKTIADAVDIFVDRSDGNGFTLLTRSMLNIYIDTTALAGTSSIAEWRYKGIYVIANQQIGQMSNVVEVTVKKI